MDAHWTVRIVSCADEDLCLAIHGGIIALALVDPNDPYQDWIKDERYGTTRKDANGNGQPVFALVCKATDQGIMYDSKDHLLLPTPYNVAVPLCQEKMVLWTTSKDEVGQCIRWADNTSLVLDLGTNIIHEGIMMDLRSWENKITQRWKIVPQQTALQLHLSSPLSMYQSQPSVRIYSRIKPGYNLTIRNGTVMVALADPADKYQHWIKETTYAKNAKDSENRPAFALVNKATGQAIKQCFGQSRLVRLAPFNQNRFDESILWTESTSADEHGFRKIRVRNRVSLVFDLFDGQMPGRVLVGLWGNWNGNNQYWKIEDLEL